MFAPQGDGTAQPHLCDRGSVQGCGKFVKRSLTTLVMDQWLLVVTSDPAIKGLAKDMEVAGAGPVHYHFSPPLLLSLTMCSSERCLSFMSPWYIDHLNFNFLS